jgi:hypothetical protein
MRNVGIFSLWDRFWFSPQSALPLALFRIVFGALVFISSILLGSDLFTWYGSHGIISVNTIEQWHTEIGLNFLYIAPNNDTWLVVFYATLLISALFVSLGLGTRLACFLVFICLTSFYHRNPFLLNSGDTYMRMVAFWLMFSDCGKALSIDRLLKVRKEACAEHGPSEALISPWGERLIQIQLCLVYANTAFAKLHGAAWLNGTAVYYTSRLIEFQRFPLPFIFDHLWTIKCLTWGTLAIEIAMFTLIWYRPCRYAVLILATIMHLTIDYSMNIPLFQWIMIGSFILFIDAKDLVFFKELIERWFHTKDNQPSCLSSARTKS